MGSGVRVGLASATFEDLGVLYVSGQGDAARQKVHDPLHVRAAAFVDASGRPSGVLVTGDVMDWHETRAPCRLARRRIAEQHGVEPERISFIASHTHSAAYPRSDRQRQQFAERVCGVVGEALAAARPVEVGYGQVDLGPGAVFNRRVVIDEDYGAHCLMFNPGLSFRQDGTVEATAQLRRFVEDECGGRWSECGASRRGENLADGPTDPYLHLIVFREPAGRVLGGFVRMSGHAVIVSTYWTRDTVSAGYPGVLCRRLEQALGGPFLFLQGLSGDLRPFHVRNDFEACEAFGGRMAAAAEGAARKLDFAPLADVAVVRRGLRLPIHPDTRPSPEESARSAAELKARAEQNKARGGPGWQTKRLMDKAAFHRMSGEFYEGGFLEPGRLAEGMEVELAAWRIGPAVVLSLPGEHFTRTGHFIIAGARPRLRGRLVVCSCGTDSREYMPPREEMMLGGYEAVTSAVAPGAAEMLARAAIETVNAL
ncbi:MAG: hypothetical protein AMJ81_12680 [Phycisphaerae bacterium SM23_33]|nr:MAG: hypothetical protein AMJ81_12680 [Phycisphaerae bacterium SM23_33]